MRTIILGSGLLSVLLLATNSFAQYPAWQPRHDSSSATLEARQTNTYAPQPDRSQFPPAGQRYSYSPPPAEVPAWNASWQREPGSADSAAIGSGWQPSRDHAFRDQATAIGSPTSRPTSTLISQPTIRPLPPVGDLSDPRPSFGTESYGGGSSIAPMYEPPSYPPAPQHWPGATQEPIAEPWHNPLAAGLPPVCEAPAARWFAGVYGLFMTRGDADKVWLSYDTSDIRQRVLTTQSAGPGWAGGFETRFGRCFGNCAWEVVYWGLFPDDQEGDVIATQVHGDLDTILHFDSIYYDPGIGSTLVSSLFYAAERHRVRRNYEFHNVEVNFLAGNYLLPCGGLGGCSKNGGGCGAGKQGCHGGHGLCGIAPRFRLGWTAGVRFMKFDDDFLYSADFGDITFTGAPEELHYGIDVENYLVGFQVGGRADVCLWGCLTGVAETKMGVYGNHVRQHSQIYGSHGPAYVDDTASPYDDRPLDIRTSKNDVAIAGEWRLGLDYQVTPCWSVAVGYRVVAIAGVGLSTDQIPRDFIAALDSVEHVDTRGCLILHGGYLGIEYNY